MIWRRMRVVEVDVEFYGKLNHVARSTSLHAFPGGLVRARGHVRICGILLCLFLRPQWEEVLLSTNTGQVVG